MCPLGAKIFPNVFPAELVSHCLLIEDSQRLILVDTGYGLHDLENRRKLGLTNWVLSPRLDPHQTAYMQIKSLGFSPSDVTDIIPTHLDVDHAGGIQDFPCARVHVSSIELKAAQRRSGFIARTRYRPHQLSSNTHWIEFDSGTGEEWNGFQTVQSVFGLPPEILLVSLPCHTAGHMGVAVKDATGWLLHAGDAYYHHNELHHGAHTPLGLRLFQRLIHKNYKAAKETQRHLLQLNMNQNIQVFCSHDLEYFLNSTKCN